MQQKSRDKAKRWFAWVGGCVIVLILAAGGFWYSINIPPQVDIPTPVMPNPNGYDYFVRAGEAYIDDNKGVDELTDRHDLMPGETKHYTITAKETWLKQNAKAFLLLREGLKYPALHPRVRSETYSTEYSQFRDLARALVVESHVRAASGDWSGAANSVLEGLEFGYDIPRGGPLIAGLVGEAVQGIALRQMYQVSPHLDAKTARQAAKRMEHLYAGRFPYFKTMQEEKWKGQARVLEMMKEKSWRLKLVRTLSSAPLYASVIARITHTPYSPPSRLETARAVLKYSKIFVTSKSTLMNNYTKALDAIIANGRVSYEKMQHVPTSNDPLTNLLIPVFTNARWNWARMNAYSVLDMTMLALRAYRLEKGHYPANLKELVPQYLKQVPIDPFMDESLHYRLQENKYLLWSIGPDGVDNHGTPIINQSDKYAASAKYRLMDPDSKGDVVAGINMP